MSEASPVYHVTVTREGKLWVAVVRDSPAGATEVSHMPTWSRRSVTSSRDLRIATRTTSKSHGTTGRASATPARWSMNSDSEKRRQPKPC